MNTTPLTLQQVLQERVVEQRNSAVRQLAYLAEQVQAAAAAAQAKATALQALYAQVLQAETPQLDYAAVAALRQQLTELQNSAPQGSTHIVEGAVTVNKLTVGSITADRIATGSIAAASIQPGRVTIAGSTPLADWRAAQ